MSIDGPHWRTFVPLMVNPTELSTLSKILFLIFKIISSMCRSTDRYDGPLSLLWTIDGSIRQCYTSTQPFHYVFYSRVWCFWMFYILLVVLITFFLMYIWHKNKTIYTRVGIQSLSPLEPDGHSLRRWALPKVCASRNPHSYSCCQHHQSHAHEDGTRGIHCLLV